MAAFEEMIGFAVLLSWNIYQLCSSDCLPTTTYGVKPRVFPSFLSQQHVKEQILY